MMLLENKTRLLLILSESPGVSVEGRHGLVDITVTLRSGRTESWSQLREANG